MTSPANTGSKVKMVPVYYEDESDQKQKPGIELHFENEQDYKKFSKDFKDKLPLEGIASGIVEIDAGAGREPEKQFIIRINASQPPQVNNHGATTYFPGVYLGRLGGEIVLNLLDKKEIATFIADTKLSTQDGLPNFGKFFDSDNDAAAQNTTLIFSPKKYPFPFNTPKISFQEKGNFLELKFDATVSPEEVMQFASLLGHYAIRYDDPAIKIGTNKDLRQIKLPLPFTFQNDQELQLFKKLIGRNDDAKALEIDGKTFPLTVTPPASVNPQPAPAAAPVTAPQNITYEPNDRMMHLVYNTEAEASAAKEKFSKINGIQLMKAGVGETKEVIISVSQQRTLTTEKKLNRETGSARDELKHTKTLKHVLEFDTQEDMEEFKKLLPRNTDNSGIKIGQTNIDFQVTSISPAMKDDVVGEIRKQRARNSFIANVMAFFGFETRSQKLAVTKQTLKHILHDDQANMSIGEFQKLLDRFHKVQDHLQQSRPKKEAFKINELIDAVTKGTNIEKFTIQKDQNANSGKTPKETTEERREKDVQKIVKSWKKQI